MSLLLSTIAAVVLVYSVVKGCFLLSRLRICSRCTDLCYQIYGVARSRATTFCYSLLIAELLRDLVCTRWFKYDRDYLCVNKSQFVPVIFEPPCNLLLQIEATFLLSLILHQFVLLLPLLLQLLLLLLPLLLLLLLVLLTITLLQAPLAGTA